MASLIACVLISHFPFAVEKSRHPELQCHNVIVVRREGIRSVLVDFSPTLPLQLGMSLQEAQARCKNTVLIEADLSSYQHAFNHILMRLGDCSPAVEAAGLGCAYIGLQGLQDTYGSEERLIDTLLQSVPQHMEPRIGIGLGKFPAYLAALSALPGRVYKPPNEAKDFVGRFSVDVLPVSWEVKTRLHSFGLHTVRSITELSLGPVQAQFGPTGARIWRLANGVDDDPLIPQAPEEELTEYTSFPTPTANLGPILMVIENLLARLFTRLEMQGRFARTAILEGHMYSGSSWQRQIVFKSPVGDKHRAYFVLKAVLDTLTVPSPLEDMRLTLTNLTGEVARQGSLFQEARQRDRMGEVIAQLKVTQGHNPIYKIREVEPWSRIPERQAALVPYEP